MQTEDRVAKHLDYLNWSATLVCTGVAIEQLAYVF
ncbi:2-succinyl-5-enolpyruvyl-6-hydroxy-3-cyclohexene-1-carboxylate synthase [Gossypium arboreum]|uniref:2-succinyl-5-enolpyruvyl-6-hydroxy-3-cyclohexene-1-carboxylate synthase n=1 Tax=Gossypium arboreum TaxID=29729 RepID=A0A0B0NLU6_GOSAR|nr:2-succinyl-5-enolpyruvyl-6-hydroxy-3-cyclohexene-1-carboxylate synthase [Gossypium arboreum]